jgi:endonuclease/exonuclease/phosphatase family metal-dependent hydrolase
VNDSFYEELKSVVDKFPKYHMKLLLGDFNAKVGKEDLFKPTIGNENLHEISNDSGVRVVNFATSKNPTMFPHCNIHKYNWTSPDKKPHNAIDLILVERRKHSSVLDVRSFKACRNHLFRKWFDASDQAKLPGCFYWFPVRLILRT